MSFTLPDLVIESVLRDGFESTKNDPTIIEDVFGSLTRAYAANKYGDSEIQKIKDFVSQKEISIVHSFHIVNSNIPCISIQLSDDDENVRHASMGDYESQIEVPFSTPEQLASVVKISSFQPNSYDPVTGIVQVPDSIDLSNIYANLLFVDAAGAKHTILGGIDNTLGRRRFTIAKQADVDLGAGAEVQTSITYDRFTVNGNREQTQIIIGIHTQDPLLTKYVYTLIKYFLLTRKPDICNRNIQLSTYKGSDFSRNLEYKGDMVFTRFIHLNGQVFNTWRQDKVQLIDNVEVTVTPIDEDC